MDMKTIIKVKVYVTKVTKNSKMENKIQENTTLIPLIYLKLILWVENREEIEDKRVKDHKILTFMEINEIIISFIYILF